MSKSTPLSELNTSPDMAQPTQPLVQDILKEIQQETSEPKIENVPELPSEPLPVEMQGGGMVEQNPEKVYAQQQEDAQQYQMDTSLQQPDQQHETPPDLQTVEQQYQATVNTQVQNPTSTGLGHRIFEEVKEPLLVAVLTILVSVPAVTEFLGKNLARLPGGSSSIFPVLVKALVVASLFYVTRKFI